MSQKLRIKPLSSAVFLAMSLAFIAVSPMTAHQAQASQAATGSGKAYYIGDSIAVGAAAGAGSRLVKARPVVNDSGKRSSKLLGDAVGQNQAVGGTPPIGVLYYIQQNASKLRGQHVVLSTGASNSGDIFDGKLGKDLKTIEKQLQTLKNAGATVTVMGVADNFLVENIYGKSPAGTGANLNRQLQQLASKYGFEFSGGFTAIREVYKGKESFVHGRNYSVAKKYRSAGVIGGGGGAPSSGNSGYTPTTQSDTRVPNPANSGMTDEQIVQYFNQHGRRPGLSDMVWPNDKFTRSASRFGEVRGSRPHTGLDLSGNGEKTLAAGDSGVVNHASSSMDNGAGNYISVQRDNQGKDANLQHTYRYLHMKQQPSHRLNQKVTLGETLGIEGNSGAGIKDIHLHLDYVVPKGESRDVFLNNNGTGRYTINGVSSFTSWKSGVYTDPTPYYGKDQLFTMKEEKDRYRKWLGNSWRWQFNTLYGTNLPTAPGSKGPTQKLPNTTLEQLKKAYDAGSRLTPDEMAAIRMSMANAAVAADGAGYNLGGQWVTQRTLASFMTLDDGADFATLPSKTRTLKVHEMSPKEIIHTIGNSRYGNLEWLKAMMEVNSKGLMTEYLMMQAEENFIREHNTRLKQRVEGMLATLTSGKLLEYSKKIQAMQISAEANVVPSMIDLQLEASGDEYVDGIANNGLDTFAENPADNVFASSAGDGNPATRAIKAAQVAANRALARTIGYCARYVRIALQQAGYNFTSQTSAYMYHTNGTLEKAGFTKIAQGSLNGYTPQIGDIVVWHRTSKTPHGHIQIYIGNNRWASDFKHSFYPYKSQRTNFTIYRDLSAAPAGSVEAAQSAQGGGRTVK